MRFFAAFLSPHRGRTTNVFTQVKPAFNQVRRQRRSLPPLLETLENRLVLSQNPTVTPPIEIEEIPGPNGNPIPDQTSGPEGYSPAQVQQAYGVNLVMFGAIHGEGQGQTIAVIDTGDQPNLVGTNSPNYIGSDLYEFDRTFGLPDPPSFAKFNQTGGTRSLPTDPGPGDGGSAQIWRVVLNGHMRWRPRRTSILSNAVPHPQLLPMTSLSGRHLDQASRRRIRGV